jgi:dimethylsulfone monooxygenase
VTCRPTKKQAEDYFHHCIVDQADWSAVDGILALKNISPQTVPIQEYLTQRSHYAQGMGGLPIIGDPDHSRHRLPISAKPGSPALRSRWSTISTNCRISLTR